MSTDESLNAKDTAFVSAEKKIDVLQYELDYIQQKQWNIFSWCSAILVTIIGGTIVLNRNPKALDEIQRNSIYFIRHEIGTASKYCGYRGGTQSSWNCRIVCDLVFYWPFW